MFNDYFLSFVATGTKPLPRPFFSIATMNSTPSIRWLGLLCALLLHIGGLMLLLNRQPDVEPLTLPKPIMVSLISASEEKKSATEPPAKALEKPTLVKPKKELSKPSEKPKSEIKPKVNPKPTPAKPLISHQSDLATSVSTPATETVKPLTEALPKPQAVSSPATSSQAIGQAKGSQGSSTSNAPLTLPNLNANYLHNPAPHYPSESRQEGEEGTVLLRVFVGVSGNAEQVTLKKSSGFSRLDDAALTTVKRWRFVPAHRGDQTVSAWVVVPVSFSLDE